MRAALAVVAALVLAMAAACSSPRGGACPAAVANPPAGTPSIAAVARTTSGAMIDLADGAGLPVLFAPQGGFVVFPGVRARHLDGCGLQVTADLRDPTTNKVIGLEGRPVMLTLASDGSAVPADPQGLENWSNVPACPSAAATRGVVNTSYRLEIAVIDREGHQASTSLSVTPFCGDPGSEAYCTSSCSAQSSGAPAFR